MFSGEYAQIILPYKENTPIDIKSANLCESRRKQKKSDPKITFQDITKWAKKHLTLLSL
jgi:hypothetical protein